MSEIIEETEGLAILALVVFVGYEVLKLIKSWKHDDVSRKLGEGAADYEHQAEVATDPLMLGIQSGFIPTDDLPAINDLINSLPDQIRSDPGLWLQQQGIF